MNIHHLFTSTHDKCEHSSSVSITYNLHWSIHDKHTWFSMKSVKHFYFTVSVSMTGTSRTHYESHRFILWSWKTVTQVRERGKKEKKPVTQNTHTYTETTPSMQPVARSGCEGWQSTHITRSSNLMSVGTTSSWKRFHQQHTISITC